MTRFFYNDMPRDVEATERPKRWEVFDLRPSTMPGFVVARREDGKTVTIARGRIEVDVQIEIKHEVKP